jgi:HlyD family secretion protein
VALVTVGTQVSGQIRDLLVDFNSEVKAGQLLAQIDPETFEYRVRSAQADVDAARAAVATAQANLLAAMTQVSRAQVDLTEAQRDLDRKQSLVEKQFIAQSEADKARALVNTSQEALKAVQAQVGVAQAGVRSAQAGVAQREAAMAQARIDLARTRITSPVNGIVIKRTIERGQTVAASLQAPELFIIAQNLRDMQVEAAIDESDVGRLRTGQKASFTVDAYPGQTFEGEIRQVRKAASNVANVVTYVAVVGFANTDGKLLPGMTANVRVVTEERSDVLKVPNSALRMRIAGVEPPERAKGPAAAASGAGHADQPAPSASAAGEAAVKLHKPRPAVDGQPREANRMATRGRIYVTAADGKPRALNVRLGVSDGSMTELLLGPNAAADLKEGTEVIVGTQSALANSAPKTSGAGPRPPF